MRLTTKGRFAVTAMIDLGLRQNNGPVTLAAISQRQQISLSYLEQLFGKLRRHELVESTRGPGGGYTLGQAGGADSHTLTQQELPAHSHGALKASTAVGNQASPDNAYLAASNVDVPYTGGQGVLLGGNSGAVTNVGGSQPHENRSPFLVMNFVIALQGIFPSRN